MDASQWRNYWRTGLERVVPDPKKGYATAWGSLLFRSTKKEASFLYIVFSNASFGALVVSRFVCLESDIYSVKIMVHKAGTVLKDLWLMS